MCLNQSNLNKSWVLQKNRVEPGGLDLYRSERQKRANIFGFILIKLVKLMLLVIIYNKFYEFKTNFKVFKIL